MADTPNRSDQPPFSEHSTVIDGYDFSEQIGHLLRRAYQRHTAIFQKLSLDSNLTAIQFVTLCTIIERGSSSMIDIVDAAAIDPTTVRGVINRLRSRHLVDVARDPEDHRKTQIEVTPEGEQIVANLVPKAKEISNLTMEALNQTEAVALILLLKKMLHIE